MNQGAQERRSGGFLRVGSGNEGGLEWTVAQGDAVDGPASPGVADHLGPGHVRDCSVEVIWQWEEGRVVTHSRLLVGELRAGNGKSMANR